MNVSLNHIKIFSYREKKVFPNTLGVDGIEGVGLCPYSSFGRIKQSNSFGNLINYYV